MFPQPIQEPAGPDAPEVLPRPFGPYQLVRALPGGGMGVVYEAVHPLLRRKVALKTLKPQRQGVAKLVVRFRRELAALGNLDHPNLVRASDAGELDGRPYLVMDFVEGIDLHRLISRLGPLPVAEACAVAQQVARGLHYLHEQKLVHRDVKPSNLMLTPDGTVKILDLGLALMHADHPAHETMSDTGLVLGTGDYMAPEQAKDAHRVDIRADLYSLGCTLYKLLTGQPPFSGPDYDTAGKKMLAHAQDPPPPIQQRRLDLPDALAALVHRLLEKDPAQRFQDPREVVLALEPFCPGADLSGLLGLEKASKERPVLLCPSPGENIPVTKSFLPRGSGKTMAEPTPATRLKVAEVTPKLAAPESRKKPNNPFPILGIVFLIGVLILAGWFLFRTGEQDGTTPLSPPKNKAEPDWPEDYPAVLRQAQPGQTIDLLALQTQLNTKDNWGGARAHQQPPPTLRNPLMEPLWCRRIWGKGVYYPDRNEINIRSLATEEPTLFALADDRRQLFSQVSVVFFEDKSPGPRGLFLGWEKKGAEAWTNMIQVLPGPAKIRVGKAVFRWENGKEKSWQFFQLMEFEVPLRKGISHVDLEVNNIWKNPALAVNSATVSQVVLPVEGRGRFGIWVQNGGARIWKIRKK